ncbi:MAG: CpsD/CapB family tyrosine-protein kinase [Oscillospiraceae bacterium]|nr:CpsD/CapB family tyrosine-protein kinase [Oscillospiraceae bacterium]
MKYYLISELLNIKNKSQTSNTPNTPNTPEAPPENPASASPPAAVDIRESGYAERPEEYHEYILNKDTPFFIKESYNILRTNIVFALSGLENKIIGVTSAESSAGKSINCLNAAISFAAAGYNILLVDFDFRIPEIGRLLKLRESRGIANILAGECSVEEALIKSKIENLSVLLSGIVSQDPSKLLESEKMKELISGLAGRFDYVIVDMPPVNIVADPSIISKHVSGIIITARQKYTKRRALKDAVNQLKLVNTNILGFLLNDFSDEFASGKKYYYYYNYSQKQ